jgi:hypothetical protein
MLTPPSMTGPAEPVQLDAAVALERATKLKDEGIFLHQSCSPLLGNSKLVPARKWLSHSNLFTWNNPFKKA